MKIIYNLESHCWRNLIRASKVDSADINFSSEHMWCDNHIVERECFFLFFSLAEE